MPRKSGKQAYEEVKKIAPGVKALFASGYTADVIHRKSVLEEGLNFIAKPVAPDILLKENERSTRPISAVIFPLKQIIPSLLPPSG